MVHTTCFTALVAFYVPVCEEDIILRCDYTQQISKFLAIHRLPVQFIEDILHIEVFIVS